MSTFVFLAPKSTPAFIVRCGNRRQTSVLPLFNQGHKYFATYY
jgi:hypothetical protein